MNAKTFSDATAYVDPDFQTESYCQMNSVLDTDIIVFKVKFFPPKDELPEGVKFGFIRPMGANPECTECTFTRSYGVVRAMHQIAEDSDTEGVDVEPVALRITTVKKGGKTFYNVGDTLTSPADW